MSFEHPQNELVEPPPSVPIAKDVNFCCRANRMDLYRKDIDVIPDKGLSLDLEKISRCLPENILQPNKLFAASTNLQAQQVLIWNPFFYPPRQCCKKGIPLRIDVTCKHRKASRAN